MNANARLTTLPGQKKSRKKGRRDKPFRELRMCESIMENLHRRDPKPEITAPKPYVPLVITDFSPSLNPKVAKKLRRKQRRKYNKELAQWNNEQANRQSKEEAAAEAEAQASRKRKADEDLYQGLKKKSRNGEAAPEVDGRKKLEPKSRKSKPEPKVRMPPNDGPEPELGLLPIEILKDMFRYRDSFDRTCIALTCKTFASIIMQGLLDWKNPPEDDKDTKTTEQGSKKGAGAAGKKTSQNEANKAERKGANMTAGFPDIRKRYNWDGERHATVEHLHSSIAPDHLYCHVCRQYKVKNGGIVKSYKNCPKKTLMADKTSPSQQPNAQLPASMLARPKIGKEKPIPDEIIWTEEDWSVFKLGAIRSRMGLVQTCCLCPSCTDSRNSFLFPPPPETPLERFVEYDNPIGGDLKNGRVPYGQEGPNVRDPRRVYLPEANIATVEDNAREAGKGPERGEISND